MKRTLCSSVLVLCSCIYCHAMEESDSTKAAAMNRVAIAESTAKEPGSQPSDSINIMPTVKSQAQPHYPELAQRAGIEGMVYVKILVDTDGKPREVALVKSDAAILDTAALDAARTFEFTPAYKNGKPVDVWVTVPFKFKLPPRNKQIEKNARELPSKLHRPTVLVVAGPKALEGVISYPDEAVRKRIEGAVAATVRLDNDKHTTEVKILSGLEGICNDEVLRALSSYKFYEDKELGQYKGDDPISIVVQFILPPKK